jgi:hypothetical protein
MRNFNQDLKKVYNENLQILVASKKKPGTIFYGIDNYLSICGIGYAIRINYGCFTGNYQMFGKLQVLISRAISGGRNMNAWKEKYDLKNNKVDCEVESLDLVGWCI